jgi:hypothetical protein
MNAISSELVHCHAFYLCNDSSILQKPSLFWCKTQQFPAFFQ